MRTYTIRQGINKGAHCIFDSPDEASDKLNGEFKKLNIREQPLTPVWTFDNGQPKSIFPHWLELTDPLDQGYWVMSDDGRVLQCLRLYRNASNRRVTFKNGTDCRTTGCKTAIGVFFSFPHADGTFQAQKMNADAKFGDNGFKHNTSSYSNNKSVLGTKMNDRKRLFAYYMYISGDPVRALSAVKRNHRSRLSNMYLVKSALSLLQDEGVVNEIRKYLPTMPEQEKFRKKVLRTLQDKNITLERLAEHIDGGLDALLKPVQLKNIETGKPMYDKNGDPIMVHNPKTGGMAHQSFIKMGIDLIKFGEDESDNATDDKTGLSKGKSEAIPIEGVRFEEQILPPPKSIRDKVDLNLLKDKN